MIPSEFIVTSLKNRDAKPQNMAALRADAGKDGSSHRLSQVKSCNLDLDVFLRDGDRIGTTKITLRGVPVFMVNAFNLITSAENMKKEGLFRKESNSKRLKGDLFDIYFGTSQLESDSPVHDVCAMVKRFIRGLKTPLIHNADLREKLFEMARKRQDGQEVTRAEFSSLFEARNVDGEMVFPLDDAHLGTLGFLMRQLNRLAQHNKLHQMDSLALSLVFAPNVFASVSPGEAMSAGKGKKKKASERERRQSQEDILSACTDARADSVVSAAAVRLLIDKANFIGVTVNCYISRGPNPSGRSSSVIVTPSSRVPLGQDLSNLQKKDSLRRSERVESAKEASSLKTMTTSVKLERIPTNRIKKADGERSSSRVRDVFMNFVRARSPGRKKAQRRETLPGGHIFSPQLASTSSAGSDAERTLLDIAQMMPPNVPMDAVASTSTTPPPSPLTLDPASASSSSSAQRVSRSHQRRAVTRNPTPGRETAGSNRTSKVLDPDSPSLASHTTHGDQDSKSSRSYRREKRADQAACSKFASCRDNPVSLFGEDAFSMDLREQRQPPRRRRHTTPVKTTSGLRRNQPNVQRAGLPMPRRRVTQQLGTEADCEREKENRHATGINICKRRSFSTEDEVCGGGNAKDILEDELLHDSMAILDQKGMESRNRRAKRSKRLLSDQADADVTMTAATPSPATVPALSRVAEAEHTTKANMVSVGLSPIVIKSNEKTGSPLRSVGSAIVGESYVVDSFSMLDNDVMSTPPHRDLHQMDVSLSDSAVPSSVELSAAPATPRPSPVSLRQQLKEAVTSFQLHDSPRSPSKTSPSASAIQLDRRVTPTARSPPPVPNSPPPSETLERQSARTTTAAPRMPTRGTPPRPGGVLSIGGGAHPPLVSTKRPSATFARPALMAQHSLDSQLGQVSQVFRAPSSRLPTLHRNSSAVTRSRPPLQPKPAKVVSSTCLISSSGPSSSTSTASMSSSFRPPAPPPLPPTSASSSSLASRRVLSAGRVSVKNDDPFADCDAYRASILGNDGTEDETDHTVSRRSTRNALELRPSVAFIRSNNNGMVKDRVNMFSQLNTLETINSSGRSSSLSARSSLGAVSFGSSEESEWSKPTGPPVTHGIQIGNNRPSPSRSIGRFSSPSSSPKNQ